MVVGEVQVRRVPWLGSRPAPEFELGSALAPASEWGTRRIEA